MSVSAPLVALFLFVSLSPPCARADEGAKPGGLIVEFPPTIIEVPLGPDSTGFVEVDPDLEALVEEHGFRFDDDLDLIHEKTSSTITMDMMVKAGMGLDDEGRLVDLDTYEPIPHKHIPKILDGLLSFAKVARHSPADAGKALQEWGVPVSYDGIKLLNPDGTATYFGLMLYEGLHRQPDKAGQLSGERLSKSLELFGGAYTQAFSQASPDIAQADLARAWGMLGSGRREGETPIRLQPSSDPGDPLKRYQDLIKAGLTAKDLKEDERQRMQESLESLEALGEHKYYPNLSPGGGPAGPPSMGGTPPHGVLPTLLRVIDNLGGEPLTPAQQEALIKSFPMGETIWNMKAHELWQQGLTGEGVKVAVVDAGIAPDRELDGVVDKRRTFTEQRGRGAYSSHATHVAGIIHVIAPNATINSYKGLDEGGRDENYRRAMDDETLKQQRLIRAIDAAVADGNDIVNISIAGRGLPSGPLASKVQEYAEKGVIFVISAGNMGAADGVSTPSIAESALTVGAVNAQGRVTTFSGHGDRWDPVNMGYAVKNVFLAPGKNVTSTVGDRYVRDSGTSMAAPHLSGTVAQLVQYTKDMTAKLNPLTMSRQIQDALTTSAEPALRRELPVDVQPDQGFFFVRPVEAWRRLQSRLRPSG